MCAAAALWMLSPLAAAAIELTFAVEDIQGEGWQAQGITLSLIEQAPDTASVAIQVQHLELPDDRGSVQDLHLECPEAVRSEQDWQCANGRLTVQDGPIQAQDGSWQGSYAADGRLQLSIPKLAVAKGNVALELAAHEGTWSAQLRPYRVSVPQLAILSRVVELPRGWGVTGRASGLVRLDGDAAGASRVDADLVVEQLA